jgi:hypothetical protein
LSVLLDELDLDVEAEALQHRQQPLRREAAQLARRDE